MGLYNYIFWHNTYEGIWYAIPRDEQQVFFGVNKENAKNIYKSKNINTLIAIVEDPTIVKEVNVKKQK